MRPRLPSSSSSSRADFASLSRRNSDWGSFFGRVHTHPVSGFAKDYPEFHLVWRDATGTSDERHYEGRINNLTVHSDVTYEVRSLSPRHSTCSRALS